MTMRKARGKEINILSLMTATEIPLPKGASGKVLIEPNMSGLESNPKNDWLYFGLSDLHGMPNIAKFGIRTAAIIGSGNGIDAIGALSIFTCLKRLYITDLLPGLLPGIEKNVRANYSGQCELIFLSGRDCEPIPEKVELIYANLPLLMTSALELESGLATTTLTDANAYAHLSSCRDDALEKYSLLSQLGFLLSAREKLVDNGTVVTLIGGRIPFEIIIQCFKIARLSGYLTTVGFKKQSDPQFFKEYAEHERRSGVKFAFYDYELALQILSNAPGILFSQFEDIRRLLPSLVRLLRCCGLDASTAYQYYLNGKEVGHFAFAFEATKTED